MHDQPLLIKLGSQQEVNVLWLTLSNQCNIYCQYCFNYVHYDHDHLSKDMARGIVENHLSENSAQSLQVNFFGGEPTVNPKALFAVLDYMKEKSFSKPARLMTNGIINSKTLNMLLDYPIIYQISYDGQSASLRLSKKGAQKVIQHTRETIQYLVGQQQHVHLRCTVHEHNTKLLPSIVNEAVDLGVRSIAFAPICEFGEVKRNGVKQPNIGLYLDNLAKATSIANSQGLAIEFSSQRLCYGKARSAVSIPFVWLPDGSLSMTITHATSKHPEAHKHIIGYYDADNNRAVVDNEKVEKMKANFHKNRQQVCSNCPLYYQCGGILHLTPFLTDTYIEARDSYFCNIEREFFVRIQNCRNLAVK